MYYTRSTAWRAVPLRRDQKAHEHLPTLKEIDDSLYKALNDAQHRLEVLQQQAHKETKKDIRSMKESQKERAESAE